MPKDWEEALRQLKDADSKGSTAWHQKWSGVLNIVEHRPALYLAGGFSTDAEFYEKVLEKTRQMCSQNMRIAKLTTPGEVTLYSVAKLGLAIRYIEATSKKSLENRDDVEFAKLRIQLTASGKKVTKSLSEVTTTELREVLSQLAVRPKKAVSPDMQLVLGAVKRSGIKGVKATYAGGSLVLRVPMAGVAAVARELTDFDPTMKH